MFCLCCGLARLGALLAIVSVEHDQFIVASSIIVGFLFLFCSIWTLVSLPETLDKALNSSDGGVNDGNKQNKNGQTQA